VTLPRDTSHLLTAATIFFWIAVVLWLPTATLVALMWGWSQDLSGALGIRVFISTVALFVPGLAVLGYLHGSGWARFRKALALLGIGYGGVVLAAAIALFLYPQYPNRGPHELVASAMIAPAIALPTAALVRWKDLAGARSWIYCTAWAAFVLGSTIAIFSRKAEMSLPLSATVARWEHTDIQDYANYFLRAEGVELDAAARYAATLGLTRSHGALGCAPQDLPGFLATSEWELSAHIELWVRDDRVQEKDLERYPSGTSGCYTHVAWAAQTLFFCDVCDWGI
jgi:hypothetical protein